MTSALRQFAKAPGFCLVAILTLALGVGTSTAIFSVVHALLLSPLRYTAASELVQVQSVHPEQGASGLAPATFADVVSGNHSFANLAAQYYYYVNLTGSGTPALLNSAEVTADYFTLFGVAPLRGRAWTRDETLPNATPVIVLGHAVWKNQFNARESVVGEQVMLDNVAHTVIGVMPASFKDPSDTAQLWRPMRAGGDNLQNRSSRYWTLFGRLKSSVGVNEANSDLAVLGRQLEQAFPEHYKSWSLRAVDLRQLVVGDYRTGLLVVLGAVGCVMLITCANLASLSIVRAVSRRKEIAIRIALGSSRAQLLRQLLGENLLIAACGGAAGVLLARWGLDSLLATLPQDWLPRADEIALNVPVLATTLGLTLLTGLIAGLAPGITASRIDANTALKDGVRGTAGLSAQRLRATLVVGEIALALILLAGTGLLGRSFVGLLATNAGLDASRVLSLTVSLPSSQYTTPDKCWEFFARAEREVSSVPAVEAAGFTQTSPFRWGIPFSFEPVARGTVAADLPPAFTDSVSVDFFPALGIPLRAGRLFTPADDHRSTPMVILNERAAQRYFGSDNPLGRFITPDHGETKMEVVGVVGDVRRSGLTAEPPLQVYRPLAQRTPPYATLMVRTALPPATLAKSVQAALWRVDSNIPVSEMATMETYVSRSVTQPRLYLTLFVLFASLALLLAAIGLYGLIAHAVEQRTREFGIRSALGARPHEVIAMVLREGATLVAFGLVLGLAGAFGAVHLLQNMVFGTSLHDPAVFLIAPLVLSLAALAACYLPARRASQVDPLTALRAE